MSDHTLPGPANRTSDQGATPQITVRPLERGDTATICHVLEQMSPRDRFERFHAPMPRIPTAYVRYLADVDGVERGAIVCREGEAPVGVGWFFRYSATTAEIAIAVATAARGRRWGTRSFEAALTSARCAGYTEAAVFVRTANRRIRGVLERRGFHINHVQGQLIAMRALSD